MEKRINQKTRTYLQDFKEEIKQNIITKFNKEINDGDVRVHEFLQFVYDFQPLEFKKDDFQKRKRIKNIVPFYDRCCALRANKQQCTRRKKSGEKFCGTHIKGIPHGELSEVQQKKTHNLKQVFAQEIKGIVYWIDDENNVYDNQDIFQNKDNPKIIAKYTKTKSIDGKDHYNIPSLFGN
tara:strand:+ start:10522 stop:11061 length:540 start_codon:yes stop_codon:yes gene_type:complete